MKIFILVLLFGILFGGCGYWENHEIRFLSESSGLKIPGDVSDIRYQYVKNAGYNYPYDFYARFKCDSGVYMVIRKQITTVDQTGASDVNMYISSRMLANDKEFLYGYNQMNWWDVPKDLKPEKLYVNYFEDRGRKRIGDSTSFNGKIALYYNNPYCYLYIVCFPTE